VLAIEPFTLHDLRRTAATCMAGLGIAQEAVVRVSKSVGAKISGVARSTTRFALLTSGKAGARGLGPPYREPASANAVECRGTQISRGLKEFDPIARAAVTSAESQLRLKWA